MNKGHCVHSLGVKHEGTVRKIIIIFFIYLNNIFMSICTSHFGIFFFRYSEFKKKAVFMFVSFKYSLFNNLLVLIILQTILKKKMLQNYVTRFTKYKTNKK